MKQDIQKPYTLPNWHFPTSNYKINALFGPFEVFVIFFLIMAYFYLNYVQQNFWSIRTGLTAIFIAYLFFAKFLQQQLESFVIKYEKILLCLGLLTSLVKLAYLYKNAGGFQETNPAWMGWSDQSLTYSMISALKNGTFSAANYDYGLGYPLAGVALGWIYPKDPLFPVNCLCFAACFYFLYQIAQKFLPKHIAMVGCFLFIFSPYPGGNFLAVSWSSTLSMACYFCAIHTVLKSDMSLIDYLIFGAAAGLIFATRYVDVVLLIPLGIFLLFNAFSNYNKQKAIGIALGALLSASIASGVLYSHHVYFGSILKTPYSKHDRPGENASDNDLKTYSRRLGLSQIRSIYGQLIDAKSTDIEFTTFVDVRDSIFQKNILFLLSPIGFWIILMGASTYRKRILASIFLGVLIFLFIYSTHPGTVPGCLIFHSAHYFKPLGLWFFVGGLFFLWKLKQIRFAEFLPYLGNTATIFALYALGFLGASWGIPKQFEVTFNNPGLLSKNTPISMTVTAKNIFGVSSQLIPDYQNLQAYMDGATNDNQYVRRELKPVIESLHPPIWKIGYTPDGSENARFWNIKIFDKLVANINIR